MTSWASNWKARTLDSIGVPATPFTLSVLSAWRKSTPLDPWTNNPLGMPAKLGKVARVPGTQYAMFRSIVDFYDAFAQFSKTPQGRNVVSALAADKGYGAIWRAIDALGWPASASESDWPSALLDLAGQTYADSVASIPVTARRSAGKPHATASVHEAMRGQAESLTHVAASFNDAVKATRYMIARHARYGK